MKMTNGIMRTATTGVVAAILVLSGCGKQPETGVAPEKRPLPEVGIITIKQEPVNLTMVLPGRTSPHLLAEVRPQVGGIILKRFFTEGSDVKKGQLLYQIDPATYQAARDNADAALTSAEANVVPVQLKADRFRELVEIKAVSRQEYDDAEAALKQALSDVAAAKAALETADINLAYTKVRAPISGRIGRSAVTPGALVTAGQMLPMATIQQLDPIYVDLTRPTSDLIRLRRDVADGSITTSEAGSTKVKLLFEDGTPYPPEGTMRFSEVSVDEDTGSVTLRALFPNPDQLLLPGMFVRAIVQEGVNKQAILVPQRGLTRNPKGEALVMLVGEGDKVVPRVIKVSRTVGDNWLVSEGLQAGDRVILEGIQRARPGTSVKTVPFGTVQGAPPAGAAKTQDVKK